MKKRVTFFRKRDTYNKKPVANGRFVNYVPVREKPPNSPNRDWRPTGNKSATLDGEPGRSWSCCTFRDWELPTRFRRRK